MGKEIEMEYIVKAKFGYKEFKKFEEAETYNNSKDSAIAIKMTIDEFNGIKLKFDKLKNAHLQEIESYKRKIADLNNELKLKADEIVDRERIIRQFKNEIIRKSGKNKNNLLNTIKNSMLGIVKIEFIAKNNVIQGIFKTPFDKNYCTDRNKQYYQTRN